MARAARWRFHFGCLLDGAERAGELTDLSADGSAEQGHAA